MDTLQSSQVSQIERETHTNDFNQQATLIGGEGGGKVIK